MVKRCICWERPDMANWAIVMIQETVSALRQHGVVVDVLPAVTARESLRQYFDALPNKQVVNMFSLQAPVVSLDGVKHEKLAGLRIFLSILDTPGQHLLGGLANIDPRIKLGFIDQSHAGLMAQVGAKNQSIFYPHAGPEVFEEGRSSSERHIDFLFAGFLEELPTLDTVFKAIGNVGEVYATALLKAAHLLATCKITSEDALKTVLAQYDLPMDVDMSVKLVLLDHIDRWGEVIRRFHILTAISQHKKIHVFSTYLPSYLKENPNIIFYGYKHFSDIMEGIKYTKILLNPVAKYSQGSHERVGAGMARGAILATDESSYLQEYFKHGEEIFYLPWGANEKDYYSLLDLVEDHQKLDDMRAKAIKVHNLYHTYEKRVELLLPYLLDGDDVHHADFC